MFVGCIACVWEIQTIKLSLLQELVAIITFGILEWGWIL